MRMMGWILLLIILLSCTPSILALNTPGVGKGSGAITLMVVGNDGLRLGGEYGLTNNLAATGRIGAGPAILGAKFQLSPSLAVLGGLYGTQSLFLGLNTGTTLMESLFAITEVLVLAPGFEKVVLKYQAGLRYYLGINLDIRAGVSGSFDGALALPDLQLGMGFQF